MASSDGIGEAMILTRDELREISGKTRPDATMRDAAECLDRRNAAAS